VQNTSMSTKLVFIALESNHNKRRGADKS